MELKTELVARGLEFPEGPIAMADGSIVLVEIKGRRLTRILPDGARETIAEIAGGPNGVAVGPDGAFYVCNNGGRFNFVEVEGRTFPAPEPSTSYVGGSIQKVDPHTGKITTLYDEFRGKRLLAPNDLVFDREGGMWFTDHGMVSGETLQFGSLYYAAADGSTLTRPRKNILSPNGVGLSPNEDVVYVADTITARLHACPIEAPGKLCQSTMIPGRIVVTLPGRQGFDSLAVEAGGKICVATLFNGGISIVDPDGTVEHFPFPDDITTNICFGGADMRDAWITCSGTGMLYRCRWPRPGLRLNFAR
jgi:gluconolactonase